MAPASRRVMSSRLATNRDRRPASSSMVASRSARSAGSCDRRASRRLVTEPTIEASGVRRSCETDDRAARRAGARPRRASRPWSPARRASVRSMRDRGLFDERLQRRVRVGMAVIAVARRLDADRRRGRLRRRHAGGTETAPRAACPCRARRLLLFMGPARRRPVRRRRAVVGRPAVCSDQTLPSWSRMIDLPRTTAADWLASSQSTSSSFGAPESLREKSNSACVACRPLARGVGLFAQASRQTAGHEGDDEKHEERRAVRRARRP